MEGVCQTSENSRSTRKENLDSGVAIGREEEGVDSREDLREGEEETLAVGLAAEDVKIKGAMAFQ